MDNFKEEIRGLFENNLLGAFVRNMFYNIKANLRDASLLCDNVFKVADESFTREYCIEKVSDIRRTIGMALRSVELYDFLDDSFEDGGVLDETLDIGDLVNELAKNCEEYTGLKFSVQEKQDETTYIKVSRKFVLFVILMQVRNAIIKGAKSIRLSYTIDNESVNLSLKYTKPRSVSQYSQYEEDAMQKFLCEISNIIAAQIHSEVSVLENGAVIKLPKYDHYENNDYKDKVFEADDDDSYLYTVMLSEFSKYRFYR